MEHKTTKNDRRVKRTKRAIRNAFVTLLCERKFEDITVKDVSDLADINRKTFYNYYSNTRELMEQIEKEVVTTFENAINSIDNERISNEPYIVIDTLLRIIKSDYKFYSKLIQKGGTTDLTVKIAQLLMEKTKGVIAEKYDMDEKSLDIFAQYNIAGICTAYYYWFNFNREEPIEEVSKVIGKIFFNGLNGFAENKK
ncbi:MAG: TetR/AcrR family transcriptional regulator [Ruminococcus sp.]